MEFITEIASTHNGNVKVLYFLTKKHIQSNSDFIKYQIFKTESLYSPKDKKFKEFKKLEISFKNWRKLINKFKNKTRIILEPFDKESYEFTKKFKKSVNIKISTSETDNLLIVQDAVRNFKKVFLNFSGYRYKEIKQILSKFDKKNKKKFVLMYGFQSYPSRARDMRFDLFNYFQKKGYDYGFADHSVFGFSTDLLACFFIALQKKCKFFEKHVCKKLAEKPDDYISSVEFSDMEKLIDLRNIFNSQIGEKIGEKNDEFTKAESEYANSMHKNAFTNSIIKKGKKINLKNLIFLRSNIKGLKRLDFLNKSIYSSKKIPENSFIRLNDIINKKK